MGKQGKNVTETRREDWGTPDDLFDKLNDVFDFKLDLCASKHNKKCDLFIGEDQDIMSFGTLDNICGQSDYIWINPPYKSNGGTKDFVKKALELSGSRGLVCLIPVATGNKWWAEIVYPGFDSIIFPRRFGFKGGKNKSMFDCAICIKWSNKDLTVDPIEKQSQLIVKNIGQLVDIIN